MVLHSERSQVKVHWLVLFPDHMCGEALDKVMGQSSLKVTASVVQMFCCSFALLDTGSSTCSQVKDCSLFAVNFLIPSTVQVTVL